MSIYLYLFKRIQIYGGKVYDILFACAGLLLFSLSLFDDRYIGITLNIMSFIFFIASAFHLIAFTDYYFYGYIMSGAGMISLNIYNRIER